MWVTINKKKKVRKEGRKKKRKEGRKEGREGGVREGGRFKRAEIWEHMYMYN